MSRAGSISTSHIGDDLLNLQPLNFNNIGNHSEKNEMKSDDTSTDTHSKKFAELARCEVKEEPKRNMTAVDINDPCERARIALDEVRVRK